MKISQSLMVLALFSIFATACVTTRDQLNQERGIGEEKRSTVASEELPVRKKEPEVVTKSIPPMIAAPKETNASSATPPTAPMTASSNSDSAVPVVVAPPKKDLSTYGVDEMREELAHLSGQVEELEHEKNENKKVNETNEKKYQDRIAELEKKLKEIQPEAAVVPEGKTPFEAGKDAYLSEKWDDAIQLMSQSLEKQDTGKEAEEASYVRAECYFKKQQFNKAIVDFSRFPEKYQKSPYHPKALLRIAECFEAMGRKDDAKAFYSDLSEKFPKTAEGKLAKKRLKSKT